jgi:hypothetical protein
MLSVSLVAYLKVRTSRKIAVVACFAPRAVVIAASLVRLVWLYPITPHDDPEYRLWLPAILTQIHVCLSICTACIPYMVPFFKSLDVSLRRLDSSKNGTGMCERTASASLWYRRHKKAKVYNSWDSTVLANLQYERVPQAMPHIPTPPPLSPITPVRFHTPPNLSVANSDFSEYQGLNISIPERSSPPPPQTASSFALSPTCASPVPLLWVNSFIPTRPAPTPPLKSHSPGAPYVASHTPSTVNAAQTPRFSLYPQQMQPQSRYSPDLRQGGFSSTSIPPIRSLRSQVGSSSRNPNIRTPKLSMNNHEYRMHSSNAVQPPKYSTAPLPTAPPPTTTSPTSKYRPASTQDLTSPMGAAINNYFENVLPQTAPSVPLPAIPSSDKHRQRNQQVLSPSNTMRFQTTLPMAPQPGSNPSDVLRDELFLPRDSVVMMKSPHSRHMPVVHDTWRSAKMVARES